jgi:hypothetical protein
MSCLQTSQGFEGYRHRSLVPPLESPAAQTKPGSAAGS